MNQISGKVLLKETNAGIPDALVVLYDVDPGTRPEEILANLATTSFRWWDSGEVCAE